MRSGWRPDRPTDLRKMREMVWQEVSRSEAKRDSEDSFRSSATDGTVTDVLFATFLCCYPQIKRLYGRKVAGKLIIDPEEEVVA